LDEVLNDLANQSGLLGVSGGVSGDIRDLEEAASRGNSDAQHALDVYVAEVRRQLGGMLVALGGCDALVFTGGIGENGANIRAAVCQGLNELGIELNEDRNEDIRGVEARLDGGAADPDSRSTQIWVLPTNEEMIVARQTLHAICSN
jgi:acetate kinase